LDVATPTPARATERPLDPDPRIPNPESQIPDRYASVARVLFRVLLLNLAVAIAKIVFGYASGAISILSDGFHSLTDTASNVVGLVGIRAARQPPDEDHPYGHRKYETVAAAAVTVFLLLVVVEVLRNAFNQLSGRSTAPPSITIASFVVMLLTIAINMFVIKYESGEAKRLASEVLMADATQTRGDVCRRSPGPADSRSTGRAGRGRIHRPLRLPDRARHDDDPE
jgi:divalent metal cation (Fe/Co/Zn/Cd) transporter